MVMIDLTGLREYLLDRYTEQLGPLETPCWICTLTNKDNWGYPQGNFNGYRDRMHRLAWIAFVGPIPEWKQINHECDNPRCFRAEHLYAGTQLENVEDMYARGRHAPLIRHLDPTTKSSRFVGVSFDRRRNKWKAYLTFAGGRQIGRFTNEIDAARAYNTAVVAHGLDRPLNDIPEVGAQQAPLIQQFERRF